jgi:hypothetical protein
MLQGVNNDNSDRAKGVGIVRDTKKKTYRLNEFVTVHGISLFSSDHGFNRVEHQEHMCMSAVWEANAKVKEESQQRCFPTIILL